jgi:hypothetical protein
MQRYIRKILFMLSLTGWSTAIQAQAPNSSTRPSAVPVATPGGSSNLINYVRAWEPAMPSTDPAVVSAPARMASEVKQTTLYMDGLGRPVQTVVKGISGVNKRDLVSPVTYDEYGRVQFE